MTGVARVGVDSAGGTIIGALVPTVTVNGAPIAVLGAAVLPHAPYPPPPPFAVHQVAVIMEQGSATVFAGGKPVCRAGDLASCGHAAEPGSSTVLAG
jgi:uncharacterized Zn-binding protein involved in type VI secretion